MAYFVPYIDAEGIHIPTYDDILGNLITGYKRIFGEDLYLGEDTQDYQMLSIFAKSMDDMMGLVTENYNARNPEYASGDALDLLIALNAMSRKKATSSRVTLTLSGDPFIEIPAGSKAIDQKGYNWVIETPCTLDANGQGAAEAYCETTGDITANAGTIDTIYTPVTGWTGVTNVDVATPGKNVETDAELRIRRRLSVSMNTNGTYDALLRALAALDDVEYVDLRVNDSNETDSLGIPGHSFCALVQGGNRDEIANAIWLNKAPGVGTHGNESVDYVDESGNTNVIKFTIPERELVSVVVNLTPYAGYDAGRCDPIIKQAIVNGINDMGVGKPWGVTMAYRDIYNGFEGETIPFVVTQITGTDSHGSSSSIVACDYDEILYTDLDHVSISINS